MGVTRGGVFLPSPTSYDYNGGTQALDGIKTSFPVLRISSTESVRIVTRVPSNAKIDDFEAFYMLASEQSGEVVVDLTITNMRTSLVIASATFDGLFTSYLGYEIPLTKSNPFLPGDFIEIVLSYSSGPNHLDLRSFKGASSASGGTPNNGAMFPTATMSPFDIRNVFNAPGIFLTWLDSDLNQIIEWMPGLPPVTPGSSSGTDYFVGNQIQMPFSDRKPSGAWLTSNAADTDMTITIYAEPVDANDFTELYSIVYPSVSGTLFRKRVYLPFDGLQPVLEKGKSYVVGVGTDSAPTLVSSRVAYWVGIYKNVGLPGWVIGPPRPFTSFSSKVFARRSTAAGVWLEDAEINDNMEYEVGLVFEESEA